MLVQFQPAVSGKRPRSQDRLKALLALVSDTLFRNHHQFMNSSGSSAEADAQWLRSLAQTGARHYRQG